MATPALPEEVLGQAYEAQLDPSLRRAQGSHFTPRDIAAQIIAHALDELGPLAERVDPPRVLDPAMGAGMFLCEALRQIVGRSGLADTPETRRRIATRCLFGVDKDPAAVALARRSLLRVIDDPTLDADDLKENLRLGDALFDPGLDRERYDLIVGNPPFLGGKRIRTVHGDAYADALTRLHPPANKNTDLAAHFLRRGFDLLEPGGVLGFVVTNTIAQGDTREGGLAEIVRRGGTIVAATRRLPWPGDAGVIVSLLWIRRGQRRGAAILDDRTVDSIDVFLSEHGRTRDPVRLAMNKGRAFIGCFLRGKGFVFDDRAPHGTPRSVAEDILRRRPEAREVLLPFLGGEEVLNEPAQRPHRLVIHLGQRSLAEARERFPELVAIVEEKVRPFREARRATKVDLAHAAAWWRFANTRPELEAAKAELSRVIVVPRMTSHVIAAFLPATHVFSDQLVVVASSSAAVLAVLSSRVHEAWTRLCASTLGDGLRYTPSDVFETFPFPAPSFDALERDVELVEAGERFDAARARWMLARGVGITALCAEMRRAPAAASVHDVVMAKLALDRAVLAAYGWSDLDPAGAPGPFEDAVLRRLFAENARRAPSGTGPGRSRKRRAEQDLDAPEL